MRDKIYNGWSIKFKKNIHMYCHSLTMEKGNAVHDIPCEDLPSSFRLVGIWPYTLKLSSARYEDLLRGLRKWARHSGLRYRIYTSRDKYESNSWAHKITKQFSRLFRCFGLTKKSS